MCFLQQWGMIITFSRYIGPESFELKSIRVWEYDRPAYVEDGIAYTVTIDEEAEHYNLKIIPIE